MRTKKPRKSLSPTRPPLAPVRPHPYAGSGVRTAGQLVAPRPARGGQDYPAIPHAQKSTRSRSRALGSAPLRKLRGASPRARELITLRSIESREPPSLREPAQELLRSKLLRSAALRSKASSLVAPLLRPSSLVDSLPSISLPIDATAVKRVMLQ